MLKNCNKNMNQLPGTLQPQRFGVQPTLKWQSKEPASQLVTNQYLMSHLMDGPQKFTGSNFLKCTRLSEKKYKMYLTSEKLADKSWIDQRKKVYLSSKYSLSKRFMSRSPT